MKRVFLVLAVLVLASTASFAAEGYNPQVLQKLGLSAQQIDQLAAIQDQSRAATQKAQADLAVAKAQLAKLLLDPNVSMTFWARKYGKLFSKSAKNFPKAG